MTDRVLKTERLELRPLRGDDAAATAALAGDLEISRITTHIPHPITIKVARTWIARLNGTIEIVFAVLHDEELIGCTGFSRLKETRAEIGYWLGKPWWGCGFAAAAARALVPYAFEKGVLNLLVSRHFVDNPASERILEKLGFQHTHAEQRTCTARCGDVLSMEYRLARLPHGAPSGLARI